jgi:hypothetical protein
MLLFKNDAALPEQCYFSEVVCFFKIHAHILKQLRFSRTIQLKKNIVANYLS